MLVWYDVIFVFGVEWLVLSRDIDFLWCKVRAAIKFLEYFGDRLFYFTKEQEKWNEVCRWG